jgi:rubrerythrin
VNPTSDQQILREILMREIETIHRYQEMLERAGTGNLQRFLAHAILEEKEHVAEALQILREVDPMQRKALDEDHSEHFRADGPGARALAVLRGEASADGEPRAAGPSTSAAAAPGSAGGGRDPLLMPTVGSLRGVLPDAG